MAKRAYRTEEAIKSQDKLFDLGLIDMLIVSGDAAKLLSTRIYFDYRTTVTDKDLMFVITRALNGV